MAEENYFGDSMTATLTDADAATTVPVGSLQQVQITVTADHVELDSADTILREDVAKRNLNVDVLVGVAAFDMTLVESWLGGETTTSSSPTDTNTVAKFDVVGTITSPGGTTHTATVEDVYFPSVPIMDAQTGQWIQHNFEGDGKTVTLS